jgi:hypothetical protein
MKTADIASTGNLIQALNAGELTDVDPEERMGLAREFVTLNIAPEVVAEKMDIPLDLVIKELEVPKLLLFPFLVVQESVDTYSRGRIEGMEYYNAEFLDDFGVFKKGEKFNTLIFSITTSEIIAYNKKRGQNLNKKIQKFNLSI